LRKLPDTKFTLALLFLTHKNGSDIAVCISHIAVGVISFLLRKIDHNFSKIKKEKL